MTARAAPWIRLGWLVVVCAALLALRKPWALHTPQLWAEDGSIFLTQDEQMGVRAWWEPYNGYLHLLPRLIAWIASRTADPAWWPAIYNGLAFLLNVAVFARIASPRVHLPAKPWLMLAFIAVVGTGEVLINVTNLQWTTAFLLIVQLFTGSAGGTPVLPGASARGSTWRQQLGDVAILLIVGLNGPFALLFLPLFAWRAWRDRTADSLLALSVVTLCAGVALWLLLRGGGGIHLASTSEPFRPLMFFSLIGSRLVTWPLFGPAAVFAWPKWIHAALVFVVILPLIGWALRRDARRQTRAMIVALFGLVLLAGVYRVRADTWERDDLVNGDRYFFIPRVLLAWLLIWEFDARPKAIRWSARAVAILALAMHVPRFTLPSPPNYHWADHCDPIRRGVPANIKTLPDGWWIEYPGRMDKR